MKTIFVWICLIVAVAIVGCGGGGSGTGTTSTSGSTGGFSVTVPSGDALYLIARNSSGATVDPTNLQPGNSVTFSIALVNITSYAVTIVSGPTFSTTDTAGVAGSLNSTTGAFTAVNSTNGTHYTISSLVNGNSYTLAYGVTPIQASVTGTVIDSNSVPIPLAQVVFYNSAGTSVGTVTTGFDGTFVASVPPSASRFNIVPASLPNNSVSNNVPNQGYYKFFTYNGGTYNPLSGPACGAPVPTLSGASVTPLVSQIVVAATSTQSGSPNAPPPPPSCQP